MPKRRPLFCRSFRTSESVGLRSFPSARLSGDFFVAFSVRVVSLPLYPEAAVSAVRDFSVAFSVRVVSLPPYPEAAVSAARDFSVAFSVRVVSLPPYPEAAVSAVRDFSVFFRSGRFAAVIPRGRRIIRRAGLFRVFLFGSFRCRRTPRLPYPLRGSCQSLFVRMIFRPLHFVPVAFAARRAGRSVSVSFGGSRRGAGYGAECGMRLSGNLRGGSDGRGQSAG